MGLKCSCPRKKSEDHEHDIRFYYKLGHLLGAGAFSQVREGIQKQTGKQYAVKIMAKRPPQRNENKHTNVDFPSMFRNEVKILKSLDFSTIIMQHEIFEDRHFMYAVMDKCEGGELFKMISSKPSVYESDASRICRQMLLSIQHLHKCRIVHRDIKSQNFLFRSKDSDSDLVLIDFGMAARLDDENHYLTRLCGSPHYVSPELVQRRYRFSVDVWAVGVILYLMVYGRYPFEGSNRKKIMKKVASTTPDFAEGPSPELVSFLRDLLDKDPTKRLTATQALDHPWLRSPDYKKLVSITYGALKAAGQRMTVEPHPSQEKHYERKLTELDERFNRKASMAMNSSLACIDRPSTNVRNAVEWDDGVDNDNDKDYSFKSSVEGVSSLGPGAESSDEAI